MTEQTSPAQDPGQESSALGQRYDVALLDLDGVVYAGADAIPHAAEALSVAEQLGMHLAYVTNNAARTPEVVLDQLTNVGITTTVEQIITSAQVAARVLTRHVAAGSSILVVGDEGLRKAVTEEGFRVVESAEDRPAAVVQGHSPETGWKRLSEAVVAIRGGAVWVACNTDSTLPSPRGPLPGNGAFVRLISLVANAEPAAVAGKPDPTMHAETVRRTGAKHPLAIGDRLDTDIEGANRADCHSLLVLTGVASAKDVLLARPDQRPTYISADLRGLLRPPRQAQRDGDRFVLGRWQATVDGSTTVVGLAGTSAGEAADAEEDPVDLLLVACAAVWSGNPSELTFADDQSRAVAQGLALADG